jgi:hypothetical protein
MQWALEPWCGARARDSPHLAQFFTLSKLSECITGKLPESVNSPKNRLGAHDAVGASKETHFTLAREGVEP